MLVHLHRGPQGHHAGQAQAGQRARPLRDRLRPVHVLRDLRRGVSVRRAALVAVLRVHVLHLRGDGPRAGRPRRVAGARAPAARCSSPTRTRRRATSHRWPTTSASRASAASSARRTRRQAYLAQQAGVAVPSRRRPTRRRRPRRRWRPCRHPLRPSRDRGRSRRSASRRARDAGSRRGAGRGRRSRRRHGRTSRASTRTTSPPASARSSADA